MQTQGRFPLKSVGVGGQRNPVGMTKRKKKNYLSKTVIIVSKVLMTAVNKLCLIKFPVKQCASRGRAEEQGGNCHSGESATLGISKRCG